MRARVRGVLRFFLPVLFGLTQVRNTLPEVQTHVTFEGSSLKHAAPRVVRIQGNVGYEPPNSSIYTFNGFVELQQPANDDRVSLGGRNLLLRGSTLRNTRWAIGLAV